MERILNPRVNLHAINAGGITKSALWQNLNNQYKMMPKDSKGCNLTYCEGVRDGQFYRLELLVYKRFAAELLPMHTAKQQYLNLQSVILRFGRLLAERGQPPLGFNDGVVLDEA